MIYKIIMKVLNISFWSCFVLSILFVLLYLFCAKQVGILEAKYDIWRKSFEIRSYGLNSYVSPYVIDINGVEIEYNTVAGCVVDDFIIDSVGAYNSVMEKAIKDKLGVDLDLLDNNNFQQ